MANDFEKLVEEIDDFELEKSKLVYEVWAGGFDDNSCVTDFDVSLDSGYTDVEEARKCFKFFKDKDNLMAYFKQHGITIPETTKHLYLYLTEYIEVEDSLDCNDLVEEAEIF